MFAFAAVTVMLLANVHADAVVAAKSLCDEVLGNQPWTKITAILENVASHVFADKREFHDLPFALPTSEALHNEWALVIGNQLRCATMTSRRAPTTIAKLSAIRFNLQQWSAVRHFLLDAIATVAGKDAFEAHRDAVTAAVDAARALLCTGAMCNADQELSLCVRAATAGEQREFLADLVRLFASDLTVLADNAVRSHHNGPSVVELREHAQRAMGDDDALRRHLEFLGQPRLFGCNDATTDQVFAQGHNVPLAQVYPGLRWTSASFLAYSSALASSARSHGMSGELVELLHDKLRALEAESVGGHVLVDEKIDTAQGVLLHERQLVVAQQAEVALDHNEAARMAADGAMAARMQNGAMRGVNAHPRFQARLAMTSDESVAPSVPQIGGFVMIAYVGEPDALSRDAEFQRVAREQLAHKTPDFDVLADAVASRKIAGVERLLFAHDGRSCVAARHNALGARFGENVEQLRRVGDSCKTACFEFAESAAEGERVHVEMLGAVGGGVHAFIEVDEVAPLVTFGDAMTQTAHFGVSAEVFAYAFATAPFEGFSKLSAAPIGSLTFEQCGERSEAQAVVEEHCRRACNADCAHEHRGDVHVRSECARKCNEEKCVGVLRASEWKQ